MFALLKYTAGGASCGVPKNTRGIGIGVRTEKDTDGSRPRNTGNKDALVDLASRIAANDRSAETELIERYSTAIRFFLRRRFRDPMLVDDVWQETFCRVIAKIREGKLTNPNALPGFIRSTAIFVGHEYVRQERKFRSDTSYDDIVSLPDCKPNPLDMANSHDLQKIVREVLQELTVERDRNILLRFYLDNIEKSTICRELELEPIHFDRVLYRAKQRLKLKLELRFGGKSLAVAAAVSMVFGSRL